MSKVIICEMDLKMCFKYFRHGKNQTGWMVDRVPKKSKISERPAEFTVHSRDNSKNFLLKKFKKILQNAQSNQQYRQ